MMLDANVFSRNNFYGSLLVQGDDLYNSLISPHFGADTYCETWMNGVLTALRILVCAWGWEVMAVCAGVCCGCRLRPDAKLLQTRLRVQHAEHRKLLSGRVYHRQHEGSLQSVHCQERQACVHWWHQPDGCTGETVSTVAVLCVIGVMNCACCGVLQWRRQCVL